MTALNDIPSDIHRHLALIQQPLLNDVLLGRGVVSNNHSGNKKFRALVEAKKELYMSSNKQRKASIARSIVVTIRSAHPPGRFVTKVDASETLQDVGDARAIVKVHQALRDRRMYTTCNSGSEEYFIKEGHDVIEPSYDSDDSIDSGRDCYHAVQKNQKRDMKVASSSPARVELNRSMSMRSDTIGTMPTGFTVICDSNSISSAAQAWTRQSEAKRHKSQQFERLITAPITIQDHDARLVSPGQHLANSAVTAIPAIPMPDRLRQDPSAMPSSTSIGSYYHGSMLLAHSASMPLLMQATAASPYPPFVPRMALPSIPSLDMNTSQIPLNQYPPYATAERLEASLCPPRQACWSGLNFTIADSATYNSNSIHGEHGNHRRGPSLSGIDLEVARMQQVASALDVNQPTSKESEQRHIEISPCIELSNHVKHGCHEDGIEIGRESGREHYYMPASRRHSMSFSLFGGDAGYCFDSGKELTNGIEWGEVSRHLFEEFLGEITVEALEGSVN